MMILAMVSFHEPTDDMEYVRKYKAYDPETPVADIYAWAVKVSKGTQSEFSITYVELSDEKVVPKWLAAKLDELDSADFFGTEGWRHFFGME